MGQILPLLVVVAFVAAAAWWYRRAEGAVRDADATFTPSEFRALGLPSRSASLLLFTAPACSSCAVAKRVLGEFSDQHGLPLVVADVTDHADVATRQHVFRAPTTFVIDRSGRAISRMSGVPQDRDLADLRERLALTTRA